MRSALTVVGWLALAGTLAASAAVRPGAATCLLAVAGGCVVALGLAEARRRPDPPAQVRPAAPAPTPDSADEHPYVAVLVDEALIQLPCSIFGPVFQPRRAGDRQPFVASCSCGAHVRSERHGVVASWVKAHEKGDAA